jgi:hypothetical protein
MQYIRVTRTHERTGGSWLEGRNRVLYTNSSPASCCKCMGHECHDLQLGQAFSRTPTGLASGPVDLIAIVALWHLVA